jgi:hypothetical protein
MASREVLRYHRKPESGRTTLKQRERVIQQAVTRYLRVRYPKVDFYNDWAAGAYLTYGQNTARLNMTSHNGWVDLLIAEPRHGFHGLFLELKREDVKPYLKDGKTLRADPQIKKEAAFLERQRAKGYDARFTSGLDETLKHIDWYLGNQPELPLDDEPF